MTSQMQMYGQNKGRSLWYSRALRTARGHLCHFWSITEPLPLIHRLMELNAQEVPQQGTCPASAGPGDPSVWGCAASVQEAGVRTCPVPRGSWPAAPTIINPVRPWQLWLSLIDRVGAEVLGHAGPAASPTPSAVLGKQPLALPLAASQGGTGAKGWPQLCHGPVKALWGRGGLRGHCCWEKHHPALMMKERKAHPGNALYFPWFHITDRTEQHHRDTGWV